MATIPANQQLIVDKAIASSVSLLTVREFIQATNFAIDEESFDRLFAALDDDYPVYVDEAMLNWMGYEGEPKRQLLSLKNLLARNLGDMEYKILKNDIYQTYLNELCTQIGTTHSSNIDTKIKGTQIGTFNNTQLILSKNNCFPVPAVGASARSKTHLILASDTFRSLCMMINTERGRQIRKYYLALEKLIKTYVYYQMVFRQQESERALVAKDSKIDELIRKIDDQTAKIDNQTEMLTDMQKEQDDQTEMIADLTNKVDRATDERAPRPQSTSDFGRFILLKLNEPNNFYSFYVIRAKTDSAKRAHKKILGKHAYATICLEYPYQPNAMNLFSIIRDELGKDGRKVVVVLGNYISMTQNYTQDMFVAEVRQIELNKKII
jgi:hypothetical protein